MRFHHFALEVINMEESIAFYKNCLGFQEEGRINFMGEEVVFLVLEDFRLELIPSQGQTQNNQTTHLCFEVNSLNKIMDRLKDFTRIEGPYQLDNGWQTVCYEGPDQEILEFLQKPQSILG